MCMHLPLLVNGMAAVTFLLPLLLYYIWPYSTFDLWQKEDTSELTARIFLSSLDERIRFAPEVEPPDSKWQKHWGECRFLVQTLQIYCGFKGCRTQNQYLRFNSPLAKFPRISLPHWQYLPQNTNQGILTFLHVSWLVPAWPLPACSPPEVPASWQCILAAASPPILMQQLGFFFPVLGTW